MKIRSKIILFSFLVSISTFSCTNEKNQRIATSNEIAAFCKKVDSNSQVNGLPNYDSTYEFRIIKRNEKDIQLSQFNSETDSLLIRIWLDVSMSIKQTVVEISISNDSLKGKVVTYSFEKNTRFAKLVDVKPISPKHCESIFYQLIFSKILTLPNMNDLAIKHEPGGDGSDYCVEIFSRCRYRFYTYWCPFSFENENDNIKMFVNILKYLKNILNLNFEEC